MSSGFPEETLVPHVYNFYGEDYKLDVIVALLTMGHYPNVCYHKEKRKLLTQESKSALIHKSSVNCSNRELNIPIPFFVFGEKVSMANYSILIFIICDLYPMLYIFNILYIIYFINYLFEVLCRGTIFSYFSS